MRMIGCVSPVTSGELSVFGLDPATQGRAIRARLGVCPQQDVLDGELTVEENLWVYGRYFGLSRREAKSRAADLLDFAQLTERRADKVEPLSGGMKRRLTIARSLVSDPELLLLDEPTTGLDPQARHVLWDRLFRLKRQGVTLIVTTHYMDEAEQLCDRLVVIDGGRIAAEGSPRDLIAAHCTREVLELRFDVDDASAAGVAERLGGVGTRIDGLPDRLLVYADDGEGALAEVHARGVRPVVVGWKPASSSGSPAAANPPPGSATSPAGAWSSSSLAGTSSGSSSSNASVPAAASMRGAGAMVGGWYAASSGSEVTTADTIRGTWADTTDPVQRRLPALEEFSAWPGAIDLAVGGTVLGSGETYAQAAAGEFEDRWRAAAHALSAARGAATAPTFVRPWHEMNGDWYEEWIVTAGNVEDYKKAFARFAGILRAAMPQVIIVWSPNDGTHTDLPVTSMYPGDRVVDVIAPDSYDWTPGSWTVEQVAAYIHRGTASDPSGLESWRRFAEQHAKPVALPEWGLCRRAGCGGDHPAYISAMHTWMSGHANTAT
jgi:lipooligosaccharide transport system ATP-binding protein